MCSRLYQLYSNIVNGSTNCTIGNTIGANGNANGTIGSPNGTIGKPMVPLATNGTIGEITNGTMRRTPNRAIMFTFYGTYYQRAFCINRVVVDVKTVGVTMIHFSYLCS